MDHLLTAEKLAQHLSIRPDTIRVWTRDGIIPSIRITGKVIRYDLRDVERAIRQPHDTDIRRGKE